MKVFCAVFALLGFLTVQSYAGVQDITALQFVFKWKRSNGEYLRILDFRTEIEREVDGFIPGSEFANGRENPDYPEAIRPKDDDTREVIIIATPGILEKGAIKLVDLYGVKNFSCYTGDMDAWRARGGPTEYPRFIKFKALSKLLKEDRILLIDVRNRTELNTVGQIPGSVCVPLHEIDLAFELPEDEFLTRYGFKKPTDITRTDIILTCRSGRRVLVADKILKKKGFDKLRIYSGSFKDWRKNGGEIIDGEFDLDYEILS